MAVPISHGDLIYYRADPRVQLWRLAVYHITVVPFFLGGLTLAVIFRSEPSRIGRLYFADLLGAALGCVRSRAARGVDAPMAVVASSYPPSRSAVCCCSDRSGGGERSRFRRADCGGDAPRLLSFATEHDG
jgi:hypothetical protein